MNRKVSAKSVDQETVLAAIRSAVEAAGGKRVDFKSFLATSKLERMDVYRFYAGWNEALTAAGFDFDGQDIASERLLADWGAVVRKLGRVPQCQAYNIHGKYNAATIRSRFGSWNTVSRAFQTFAAGKTEWSDVLPFRAVRPNRRARTAGRSRGSRRLIRRDGIARRRDDRPIYGAPMDLPAVRNAPINETGVVFLFGVLAERLGFHVELVRTAFPDCEAKRRIGPAAWQNVTIEFEYESRNYHVHEHPRIGCDIIVCWVHNWPECPAHLEVIALSEEILRLSGNKGAGSVV